MHLDRVGFESRPKRIQWTAAECSLYALSLGAGFDELAFVCEEAIGHPQQVFPTFVLAGVMSRESASWSHPGFHTGDYPVHQIVQAGQRLELHRPIGPTGDVEVRTRVDGIYDKGSGALVELGVRADDHATREPVFTAVTTLFVRGEGGFGGDAGPPRPPAVSDDRAPDVEVATPTLPVQSLLYRHAGHDPHPIHVDPEIARRAGMKGPILMGLNTLGIAGRALLHQVGASRPERLRTIEGAFAAPAYNGDTLITQIWRLPGRDERAGVEGRVGRGEVEVAFRVVSQEGIVLLDRGRAAFMEEGAS
jgi:acyl dehydratase